MTRSSILFAVETDIHRPVIRRDEKPAVCRTVQPRLNRRRRIDIDVCSGGHHVQPARERRASQRWLVQAVAERLDGGEQAELLRAAELIARLTAS